MHANHAHASSSFPRAPRRRWRVRPVPPQRSCRPLAAPTLRAVHRWALLTQARMESAAAGSAICLGTAQAKRTHAQSVCARKTLPPRASIALRAPNHGAISEGG